MTSQSMYWAAACLCLFTHVSMAGSEKTPAEQSLSDVVAVVREKRVYRPMTDTLPGLILGTCLDEYREKKAIVPSPEEINSFIKMIDAQEEQRRLEHQEKIKDIEQRLKDPLLARDTYYDLQAELTRARRWERAEKEMQTFEEESPEEAHRIDVEAATLFLQAWKVNQTLYREYGGRVIFQQAGPEPIDAYRQLLEERQEEGDFQILDPALAASFWNYFTNDTMHTFIATTPEEAQQTFSRAWWEDNNEQGGRE